MAAKPTVSMLPLARACVVPQMQGAGTRRWQHEEFEVNSQGAEVGMNLDLPLATQPATTVWLGGRCSEEQGSRDNEPMGR